MMYILKDHFICSLGTLRQSLEGLGGCPGGDPRGQGGQDGSGGGGPDGLHQEGRGGPLPQPGGRAGGLSAVWGRGVKSAGRRKHFDAGRPAGNNVTIYIAREK